MKANELLTRRMIEILEKEKVDPKEAMNQVNKEAHTKGTTLYELLSLYQDLEDVEIEKEYLTISSKILKINPYDYDILIQREIILNKNHDEAIQKAKKMLKECENHLKEKYGYTIGEDDVYYFVPAREYLRGLHQLGYLYRIKDDVESSIKCWSKIIKLNPRDNLGVRISLIPYYFENDVNEFKRLCKKFPYSLDGMILDLVVTVEEGKRYERKLKKLVEANRFAAFCLSGIYVLDEDTLDNSIGSYFEPGSFEEFASVMFAFDRELKGESFDRIADAIAPLCDEIEKFEPFIEEEIELILSLIALAENTNNISPTIDYLFRIIKGDKTISNKVKDIPLFDSWMFENKEDLKDFLKEVETKHLICLEDKKVRLTPGGLVLALTIIDGKEDIELEENNYIN